jgi:hypothetical protein
MKFLIDDTRKIIFGWSAKSGCSHVKKIYKFLMNQSGDVHDVLSHKLPNDIEKYTTFLFCRNPYKRLVSGFLEKYNESGTCRSLWKYKTITFSDFVDELLTNTYKMVEFGHFIPQLSEHFNLSILKSKLYIYDIEHIDYSTLEKIYAISIPQEIIHFRGGHERKKYRVKFTGNSVYHLDMKLYYEYDVDLNKFYNKTIKQKVYQFYKNDFRFFNQFKYNVDTVDINLKKLQY